MIDHNHPHVSLTQTLRLIIVVGILALIPKSAAAAPNLVPNPSFEFKTTCPVTLGNIAMATSWSGFSAQDTPDYYHLCATAASGVGVPSNTFGTESPHSGSAYAGFIARPSNPAREYLRTQLTSSLVAGVSYQVSFYVSLSDASQWAIDKLGVYFSVGPAPPSNGYVLGVAPQVANPSGNYINTKNGWTLFSGTYVAVGGEDHLTIGNFADDAATIPTPGLGGFYPGAYYYVDDFSVEEKAKQGGDCAQVVVKDAYCKGDVSGSYTYTFSITNNSGGDVTKILLTPPSGSGLVLSNQTLLLATPLPNGNSTTVTLNIGSIKLETSPCVLVTLVTKDGSCCTVKFCPSLPSCCATATSKFECDPKGNYTGTFTIVNTSSKTIVNIYLYPPAGVTMSQTYFAVSLTPGQSFTTPQLTITGTKPGKFCFRVSMHTKEMKDCCEVEFCIELPKCATSSATLRSPPPAEIDMTLL